MRLFLAAVLVLAAACSPTYDWREVVVGPAGLRATFPCKPDHAERKTAFTPGGRETVLHASGCETGGAAFVVVYADLGSAAELANAIAQWKQASLAASKAHIDSEKPFLPAGALGFAQSTLLRASGQRGDGSAVQSQVAYFARGTSVYQAAVHARELKPEITEPFFAGLRFE